MVLPKTISTNAKMPPFVWKTSIRFPKICIVLIRPISTNKSSKHVDKHCNVKM